MSQVAASNFPAGSDSPANLDDVQRAQASFIALLRDGKGLSAPVTLASAATTDIGGQNSPFVEISGTTGITSLGTNYNGPRFLRFTGALLLTHNATTLNLPGAENITTVAGDTCIAYPNSAGTGWIVASFQRAASLNTSRTLIQEAYTSSGAVATGTTIIPFDDTVPQITEGDQYFSLAFTPTNAANILEFSAVIQLANSNSNSPLIAALFQVAVANSLKVAYTVQPTGSLAQITLIHEITAGATAATTYSIRAGGSGAGTTTLNGFSGGRFFGGVGTSFFRIREYTP